MFSNDKTIKRVIVFCPKRKPDFSYIDYQKIEVIFLYYKYLENKLEATNEFSYDCQMIKVSDMHL